VDETSIETEVVMKRIALIVAVVVALAAISTGIAIAAGAGGDSSTPITGNALARASAAALASTRGGSVTETEIGDEDGYYEVEVTLAGGRQVDVHLDGSFNVTSSQSDAEEPGDRDGANDN
jgi:uncharacterized membrane protein YkoI